MTYEKNDEKLLTELFSNATGEIIKGNDTSRIEMIFNTVEDSTDEIVSATEVAALRLLCIKAPLCNSVSHRTAPTQ